MPKRNIVWIAAIVAAALATVWVTRQQAPQVRDEDTEQFRPVQQAYRGIKQHYYRPIQGEQLRRAAVKGMVGALDAFCKYLPLEQAEALERRVTKGLASGLGLRLQVAAGQVIIGDVLVNSPAHRAGLFSADRIVAIDGTDVAKLSPDRIHKLLGGPQGKEVTLTIVRKRGEPKSFTLMRGEFPVETVEGLYRGSNGRWVYLIDPGDGVAYIRIKEFVEKTPKHFQEVFRALGRPRGLILDLRDNPGGTFKLAVKISDMFLQKGLIVTTVGRGDNVRRYSAHRDGTYPEIPIVVLTNAGTASAAEVVCGSLWLHNRAVLIGTRTLGKGCVQTIVPLSGELGKISLTTSEFYFARQGSITRQPGSDRWGIDPHLQVIISPSRTKGLAQLRRRAGALRPPQAPTTTSAAAPRRSKRMMREFLALDSQLAEAMKLVRAPDEIEAILEAAAEAREPEKLHEQEDTADE